MANEEKQLLLKDLCSRLPYDTIINVNDGKYRKDVKLHPHYIFDWDAERWDAKPYLRPMSSMTEEERKEYQDIEEACKTSFYPSYCHTMTDWLTAHYFDYRGLIPMGLALEAPENMYKN